MITGIQRISGEKFVDLDNAKIVITCDSAFYTATLYSSPTPDFPEGRFEMQVTRASKFDAIADILLIPIEVPIGRIVAQNQIEDKTQTDGDDK